VRALTISLTVTIVTLLILIYWLLRCFNSPNRLTLINISVVVSTTLKGLKLTQFSHYGTTPIKIKGLFEQAAANQKNISYPLEVQTILTNIQSLIFVTTKLYLKPPST